MLGLFYDDPYANQRRAMGLDRRELPYEFERM